MMVITNCYLKAFPNACPQEPCKAKHAPADVSFCTYALSGLLWHLPRTLLLHITQCLAKHLCHVVVGP